MSAPISRNFVAVVVIVTVVVLAGVAAAVGRDPNGASGVGPSSASINVHSVSPSGRVPSGDIAAAGSTLIALEESDRMGAVVTSADGGRSWHGLGRPSIPQGTTSLTLQGVGNAVVLSAVVQVTPSGNLRDVYVWTTGDGERWRGGRVMDGVSNSRLPAFHSIGGPLVNGVTRGDGFTVVRSTDGGESWQTSPVLGLDLKSGEVAELRRAWTKENGSWHGMVDRFGAPREEGDTAELLITLEGRRAPLGHRWSVPAVVDRRGPPLSSRPVQPRSWS